MTMSCGTWIAATCLSILEKVSCPAASEAANSTLAGKIASKIVTHLCATEVLPVSRSLQRGIAGQPPQASLTSDMTYVEASGIGEINDQPLQGKEKPEG
jgi:hypothetical protein